MGVIRHKIWRDLWSNKARTLQVVLIVAMGAFAVGMIITTRNLVVEGMQEGWVESSPAMIAMASGSLVNEDTIRYLKRVEGVNDVEGYSVASVEWRLQEGDEWQAANVTARADFEAQQFFIVSLINGSWPDGEFVAVGQGTDTVFGAAVGEQVTVGVNGRELLLTVAGIVSDPMSTPPGFGGNAQFYVSMKTFEELFETRDFNIILADAKEYDETEVTLIANRMRDKLEKQDVDTYG